MKDKLRILALTSDPYDNIYGYVFIFMKLFDYIHKNNPDIDVKLISNDGVCSNIIQNANFQRIKLNSRSLISRNIFLLFKFLIAGITYKRDTTIVVNGELPELLAGFILKVKFKNIYCIIQDLRLRENSLKVKFINRLRMFLLSKIKNIIFCNKYTMNKLKMPINKFYIGNPIF